MKRARKIVKNRFLDHQNWFHQCPKSTVIPWDAPYCRMHSSVEHCPADTQGQGWHAPPYQRHEPGPGAVPTAVVFAQSTGSVIAEQFMVHGDVSPPAALLPPVAMQTPRLTAPHRTRPQPTRQVRRSWNSKAGTLPENQPVLFP